MLESTLTVITAVSMSGYARVCVYRAGASVDRGLVEGLSHGEGDVGGSDGGEGSYGQSFSLLGDLHRRLGGCCHRYLTQHHVHTLNTHKHTHASIHTHTRRKNTVMIHTERQATHSLAQTHGQSKYISRHKHIHYLHGETVETGTYIGIQ